MTEPVVLAENDDQTRRLVQLEATHEVDRDGSLTLLYTASMTQGGAELRRISSSEPGQKFYLDCDVADAFCAAWTKFKADQEANAQAEKERKERVVAEAYAIARRHPAIEIKEGRGYWDVSIPSQAYRFMQPAYYPADFLTQVKTCYAVLQGSEDVQATA